MKMEDQLWKKLIDAAIKALTAKDEYLEANKEYEEFMADQKFLRCWVRGELS